MLGRELRDLAFRGCTLAGGFIGGLWALHHQYVSPKHACQPPIRGHRTALVGTQCVTNDLSHAILAWVIPVAAGVLIGALVGLALAMLIRVGQGAARSTD